MKTRGIELPRDPNGELYGYLMFGHPTTAGWVPSPNWVPDAFWARLKHAIQAARLVDDFRADEAQAKASPAYCGPLAPEQALFARWYRRMGFPVLAGHYPGTELWPWTRGWTEQLVDEYLAAPRPTPTPEAHP